MTAEEEPNHAAAFRCTKCGTRVLETWAEARAVMQRRGHRPIEEK